MIQYPTAPVHTAFMEFCGGNHSVNKRATQDEIAYKGNAGEEASYGCNMMLVGDSLAGLYDHTINLTNALAQDQQCVCWLKIGPDGRINGFFEGNQAFNFNLPARRNRVLAIDVDTQGGCTCGVGGIPMTPLSQFASTWLEFDISNRQNGGWSGADASCLVATVYEMDIPGLQVCGQVDCSCGQVDCSTVHPGGTGQNAYLKGMENEDGVGIAIPAGPVRLKATFGYKG
ncbi:allergen asp f 4 [Trichoderma arundinaceum]|uniref:Allergen asp f 4 n=1 Tax=Trichoderma arundinaceum TaxID=490622 RepID=A0A395N8K5_TRIAR|nr:allergen asp f 4 [Trichoderma arundinaceum]